MQNPPAESTRGAHEQYKSRNDQIIEYTMAQRKLDHKGVKFPLSMV